MLSLHRTELPLSEITHPKKVTTEEEFPSFGAAPTPVPGATPDAAGALVEKVSAAGAGMPLTLGVVVRTTAPSQPDAADRAQSFETTSNTPNRIFLRRAMTHRLSSRILNDWTDDPPEGRGPFLPNLPNPSEHRRRKCLNKRLLLLVPGYYNPPRKTTAPRP